MFFKLSAFSTKNIIFFKILMKFAFLLKNMHIHECKLYFSISFTFSFSGLIMNYLKKKLLKYTHFSFSHRVPLPMSHQFQAISSRTSLFRNNLQPPRWYLLPCPPECVCVYRGMYSVENFAETRFLLEIRFPSNQPKKKYGRESKR